MKAKDQERRVEIATKGMTRIDHFEDLIQKYPTSARRQARNILLGIAAGHLDPDQWRESVIEVKNCMDDRLRTIAERSERRAANRKLK